MKHTQLNLNDFHTAVKETDKFKSFENFKKGIVSTRKNIDRLFNYYQQACRYGIEYLRLNPNIFSNEVQIIDEILKK